MNRFDGLITRGRAIWTATIAAIVGLLATLTEFFEGALALIGTIRESLPDIPQPPAGIMVLPVLAVLGGCTEAQIDRFAETVGVASEVAAAAGVTDRLSEGKVTRARIACQASARLRIRDDPEKLGSAIKACAEIASGLGDQEPLDLADVEALGSFENIELDSAYVDRLVLWCAVQPGDLRQSLKDLCDLAYGAVLPVDPAGELSE